MLTSFLIKSFLISLSAVLTPGPITAVTVSKGTENPAAGVSIAIGHLLVELPLIILMMLGLGKLFEITWVKIGIGIVGGIFLLKTGLGLLKNVLHAKLGKTFFSHPPLQAGFVLTITNPYFFIWWATIGAILINEAYQFGWGILVVFMVVHGGCDFGWYHFLSSMTYKGGQFFGQRLQQALFLICGIFLVFFSGKFFYDALTIVF